MIDIATRLRELEQSGNLRNIPDDWSKSPTVDFSSNDYLGLAARTDLQAEFMADVANRMSPLTSSASRLLAARQADHRSLETFLSSLYDGRSVLLMGSGYHANTGLIPALAKGGRTLILADKLVHASIIDGIMLSKADFTRFPHNDFDRLERLIQRKTDDYPDGILVIVESVYSMDGDRADIDRLIDIRRRYPQVTLYVDEAHAIGVEGPSGLGLVAASKSPAEVDVIVGTFGKAIASAGAFVAASPSVINWVGNSARSLIFSTALPPLVSRWTLFMFSRMLEMDSDRDHLRDLAAVLSPDRRHIFPHIVGDPEAVVALSGRLLGDYGLKVLPIRTPTVPPGTERLRISLSAAQSIDQVIALRNALSTLSPL
ncbi:MAG: aminotransferase class I/II-fold pyridoxal phosphate-dependent enzyme [Paramuribaculum sp.]|nr:aminotransferase class I/II-fold pyridoxal phosphate-dependent enzyme [Paramuribaculum sp.]